MIIGKIKDLNRYIGISKNIDTAINYVLENDVVSLKSGKYEIDSDNVYLVRDTYVAKEFKDCFFETHKKYIDLQIVFKGKESFGYVDITNPNLVTTMEYDEVKDLQKYECEKGAVFFTLEEGFALVYPEDVHLPKFKINDEIVEKAVIKIKI